MFVSKKYHNTIIALLEESRKCEQRQFEKRIEEYKNQIEDLRKLVFTPSNQDIPTQAREVDAIISISEKPIDQPDSAMTMDDMRQADLIFSGDYEEASIS